MVSFYGRGNGTVIEAVLIGAGIGCLIIGGMYRKEIKLIIKDLLPKKKPTEKFISKEIYKNDEEIKENDKKLNSTVDWRSVRERFGDPEEILYMCEKCHSAVIRKYGKCIICRGRDILK